MNIPLAISDTEEPDLVDFSSDGGAILGAGSGSDGAPLFFTANQGLVAVISNAEHDASRNKCVMISH